MSLKLVLPSIEIKEMYYNYINEWKTETEIVPDSVKLYEKDYVSWLKETYNIQKEETCPSHLVTADTYFLIENGIKIIGAINIRHSLNEYLLNYGGNIGYGVRPSERKKGYAKLMLKMGLEKCKNLGLKKVLVTCDKENIASARVIISNGGIFENEVAEGDIIKQRYWLKIG